ncbi:MAG: hypothetical protein IJ852_01090 [Alphaproteobacteria bacterium]|nr:hypothetical protein [Alphaproteobacteria bacterium]
MGIWNKVKNYLMVLAIGGSSLSVGSCDQTGQETQENKTPPAAKIVEKPTNTESADTVSSPTYAMPYRTDTLSTAGSTLLLYLSGEVKRYYVEKNNSFRMQLPYFVHEWWHHHNALLKYRIKYKLKPDEYYKLCCHDEITANLAAILTARYEYIEAQNKQSVIDKYKNTYMGFYFRAIDRGEVNPLDNSDQARKKEWSLLGNGVQKMWMDLYYPAYAASLQRQLSRFIGRQGFSKSKNSNYVMLRRKMYTIGGVDFTQYITTDIDPKAQQLALFNEIGKIETFRNSGQAMLDMVNANYKYLSGVAFDDQKDALQNLLISSKLKLMLHGVSETDLKNNPNIVSSCYQKIFQDVKRDSVYQNFVHRYCGEFSVNARKTDKENARVYAQNVKQMYLHNGVDLSSLIENFSAEIVPVQTKINVSEKAWLINSNQFLLPVEINMAMDQLASLKQNSTQVGAVMIAQPVQNAERVSDIQYIDIPNFYEPIITSSTPEQHAQILQLIRKFNEIPDVLKNCDTQAQIEYQQAQARVKKHLPASSSKSKTSKKNRKVKQTKGRTRG